MATKTNKTYDEQLRRKHDEPCYMAVYNNKGYFTIPKYTQQLKDDYLIDLQMYDNKKNLLFLLELECNTTFYKTVYNEYMNINFFAHKVRKYANPNYSMDVFGVPDVPTYYCIFNRDYTQVAITKFNDIEIFHTNNKGEIELNQRWINTKYGKQLVYTNDIEAHTDVIPVEFIGQYFFIEYQKNKFIIPQRKSWYDWTHPKKIG